MEYRERSRTERLQKHLQEALEGEETNEKNRHIRESLQIIEAIESGTD